MDGKKAKRENLATGKGSPGNPNSGKGYPMARDTQNWLVLGVGVSQALFFKGTDGRTTSVMFSTC